MNCNDDNCCPTFLLTDGWFCDDDVSAPVLKVTDMLPETSGSDPE